MHAIWEDCIGSGAYFHCHPALCQRSREIQDTLRACNQTSQEAVENFNFMRVGVGASSFVCMCVFLLIKESD